MSESVREGELVVVLVAEVSGSVAPQTVIAAAGKS